MQNRTEFLATGLVPVTNTSALPSEGCSICTDTFVDPVALPCQHIFCKECATDWLSRPSRNTCPYCRQQCFELTLRGVVSPARLALLAQAVSSSGLISGEFSTFNDDISWDSSSLSRATAAANFWMNEQSYPQVAGPARINKRRLGHDLIAMGNLLRGYAQASGRPWSRVELRDWRIIVDGLYRLIESKNGSREDALVLSYHFKGQAMTALREAEIRTSSFLNLALPPSAIQEAESTAGDLDLLVGYLALKASEECTRRRQRAEAIEQEPRLMARLGMRLQNTFRG